MASAHSAFTPREVIIGSLLLLMGGLFIGLAPIGLRFAVADGIGPQATAFWRYVFSLPLFGLIYLFLRRRPSAPPKWAVLAGVFFAIDISLWHLALTQTSVANATFLVNIGNVGVGLLAWIFLRERLTIYWAIAISLALTGAYLLSSGAISATEGALQGDLLALLAALFVSGYMLCAKLARLKATAIDVIFWATVTEAIVSSIICGLLGEPIIPQGIEQLRAPIFLAVVAHVGGQGLIVSGMRTTPAALAGVIVLIQPVAAAAISWPLFDERLTTVQIIGAALILVGITVAQIRTRKRSLAQV